MRVLHVLSQKPGFTGSGIYLRALLRESAKQQITTAAVVGLNAGDDPDLESVYPVWFKSESLPFPVVGMSDVMPYEATRWADLSDEQLNDYEAAFSKVLHEAVDEFKPDVIHCHHFWLLTALTRRLFPQHRVVASCHGTGLRQQEKLHHLKARIQPTLEHLDHGYCLTRAHEFSLRYLGGRHSVVGAGFDPDVFHSEGREEPSQFRAIFAGKIAPSKGCGELLEAVEPLDMRLSMAGSGHGQEADALVELAQAQGVELLGRLSQEELAAEMRRSHLFVLPSFYEGLPLVLAEALSCGCRVVVTELPGVMDWLPKELTMSDWVTTVPLPRLAGVDHPLPEDVPEFVSRLRAAIQQQIDSKPKIPWQLQEFLQESSWTGVFDRIKAHYGGNN